MARLALECLMQSGPRIEVVMLICGHNTSCNHVHPSTIKKSIVILPTQIIENTTFIIKKVTSNVAQCLIQCALTPIHLK